MKGGVLILLAAFKKAKERKKKFEKSEMAKKVNYWGPSMEA